MHFSGLRLVDMLDKTMSRQKRQRKLAVDILLRSDGDDTRSPHSFPGTLRKGSSKKRRKRWSIGKAVKAPKVRELIDFSHSTLAEQMTIMLFAEFKKIHPRECLKQSWKDPERKHVDAPNITQYILEFNRLTKWIQSSILVAENVKMRGKIIKKWVKVEEELYKLRNFQALCAVYSALASTPIYSLKDAWSYVAKKHMAQHDVIKVVMKLNGMPWHRKSKK